MIGTGRVWATSAISDPSVTTISTPRRSAASITVSVKVRQRTFGSIPDSSTRSWSAPATGALRRMFAGQSTCRAWPSARRIVGILHDACRRHEITSASLWAAIPHYVAAVPNPKAALALLRRLEGFTGVAIEASELEDASVRFDEQVDRAVAANPEIAQLVRQLEEAQAEELDIGGDVPSGDAIAQEFQRFLRQRGDEEKD